MHLYIVWFAWCLQGKTRAYNASRYFFGIEVHFLFSLSYILWYTPFRLYTYDIVFTALSEFMIEYPFHMRVSIMSRKKGHSAVAAAAYRAGGCGFFA